MSVIDAIIDTLYDVKLFIIGSVSFTKKNKRIFIEHDINVNNLEQIGKINHK